MNRPLIFLVSLVAAAYCQSQYIMGEQGQSCNEACFNKGMNCNPVIETDNSFDLFNQLGIDCTPNPKAWYDEDQPCYVSGENDARYGECVGYIGVPSGTQCSGHAATTQRLCRCDQPSSSPSTFGTTYANGMITTNETWIFEHVLADGDVGVITHFWSTYGPSIDDGVIIRYYIDGETKASIEFTPSLACGVGFYDTQAPWGTEWFGKGASDGSWYNNFRIPFQKSIVVTTQHLYDNYGGFYIIIRGSINVPIIVGGTVLPKNARMNQFAINATYQPLDWVPLADIPSGPGVFWMSTLAVASGNLNFLEGCFHAYFNGDTEFPGVILATGTEDYYDSGWYFDAGQFHLPVSGFTHLTQGPNATDITWSAYRFHDQDPLFFEDGFQFVWRLGDRIDPAGMKCQELTGGTIVGTPTVSQITAYAWAYTWPAN